MIGQRYFFPVVLAACCLTRGAALRAAPAELTPDGTPKLIHLPPIDAEHATATFRVKPGFRVEQVAAEPLVGDPVAIEFDENGAAYVLELAPYNAQAKPSVKTVGRILRLEDTDDDGKFDRRTVFADGMRYPSGLFCYAGGLYVGDAPDLLYLKDADGDGRADERRILYTGFGVEESGEGRLNSFRWGLDNRIHIPTNHAGGDIRPSNAPEAPTKSVRNRRVLLDPGDESIELTSGAGQHGFSMDDWGRPFVTENSDPFIMLMYDDRYLARNPHMTAPVPAVSIAEKGKFTKLMRISQIDPWRIIRTEMRVAGKYPGPTEGGQVSGFFTAATGVTVYRGDAWPEQYRGNAFVGEAANNLVYRARLTSDGLNVVSSRADDDAEFMASTDTWSRPVQFANAPDGTLYVIDMYRELIETVIALPPQLLAQLDPLAGSDLGRIYRIVPDGYKQRPRVQLGSLSTAQLVPLLEHPNGWHRDTASRLLYERQDKSAVAPLRALASQSTSPLGRVHALAALAGLESLSEADVLEGLDDDHPRVREHALRLSERFAASSPAVQGKLGKMIDDQDAWVRFQLAFSLGFLPTAERLQPLVGLLKRDGESPWMRLAIQSSLGTGAPEFVSQILDDGALLDSDAGKQLLHALVQQIGRSRDETEIKSIVGIIDYLDDGSPSNDAFAASLVVDLLSDGRGAPAATLHHVSSGRVKVAVSRLVDEAREIALDSKRKPAARAAAIRLLACDSFSSAQPALEELLDARQPQVVQLAALGVLGLFADSTVADLVLDRWRGLTPQPRATAAEMLCSRPEWTRRLLAAIDEGVIAAADIDPGRVALLQAHAQPDVREHAARVFARSGASRRDDVVAAYQKSLELPGDVDRGRAAFRKTCSACHRLEDVGTVVGADLKAIADRGSESILLNVLDPNREIKPQFVTYSVATDDGRSIAGIITAETANGLTLRRPDGATVTLSRSEIEDVRSTGLSYMPEGLESQVDVQTMADLLAYLQSVK